MTDLPISLAVFDMAGTTIDDRQIVYRVLEETVHAHGGTATAEEIGPWHGAAKHEALQALLPKEDGSKLEGAELDEVVEDFRSRLKAAYQEEPPVPLPGVPEALAKLRAAGIKVGLTTGFDREIAGTIMQELGWSVGETVDALATGDSVATGRPAPYMIFHDMEETGCTSVHELLTAGDTPRDLEAGMNAGARFVVGVLTGASDAETLGASRHTHILRSVADLPAFLGIGD